MMIEKGEINYTVAMKQLEEIVAKMENGQLDVDAMSKELQTAQALVKACRQKLLQTDEEIKSILNSDKQ